jgi:hypothetical protein
MGVDRRRALQAFRSGPEGNIGWSFAVTFGSGYGVGLIVLR